MEVATEDFSGYVGGCVPGYACAYMNTISWSSETQSNPMEINPRTAFERMFGRPGTPAEREARLKEDRSILDSVTEEARDLQRKVGARDRSRIGDYLDHVREIERRIQRTEAQNSTNVLAVDAPLGVPDTFEAHAALMFDLLAVAYQSDVTRVFSFMMSREASQRTYPELNIPQTHHDASHHGGNADNMERHAKINIHYAQLFAGFLDKLKSMPEGDGTVLDNSLIFYGAGMSDGQAHSPYPLPLIAVGRGGGKVKGDRHIVAGEWTPIANLWLTVADFYGVRLNSFAESNGRVEL
jgi:hypothetical protein